MASFAPQVNVPQAAPISKRDFKHIVVGLGGIGSSALYWLSRAAGDDVLGIEQFACGHHNGGSQDHSRIIRLAYDNPVYTRLAQQAYNAWHVVERESGMTLINKCGGIVGGSRNDEHVKAYAAAMTSQGIPYEIWDKDEIKKHYPQFTLQDDEVGLFQTDSGMVDARLANQVHILLAKARGAHVAEHTKVLNVKAIGREGVEVHTNNGVFTAKNLVVTSASWTNNVLEGVGVRLPLTIIQEQVTYYATPHLSEFVPSRFPIWIWYTRGLNFYGVPAYGEAATKAGEHEGGLYRPLTAETRTYVEDKPRTEKLTKFLEGTIPKSTGPILYTKTCLYDLTPDRNFILDMLPNHPQISVFVGSGHSYKFASIAGKILSEFAETKTTSYTGGLELFNVRRFMDKDVKVNKL